MVERGRMGQGMDYAGLHNENNGGQQRINGRGKWEHIFEELRNQTLPNLRKNSLNKELRRREIILSRFIKRNSPNM